VITAQAKQYFFDRKAVIDAVGRARAASLSKAGAFVRTGARTSIRRRKNPNLASRPGTPPYAHATSPFATLKNILFAWDPSSRSVVVGSVALRNAGTRNGSQLGTVPALMEFGGSAQRFKLAAGGDGGRRASPAQAAAFRRKVAAGSLVAPARRPRVVYSAHYPARPYMGPALAREAPKFPDVWRNAVVRGAAA
jgi:hypothetical protein